MRLRSAPPAPQTEPVPEWKNHLAMVEALNAAFGGRDLRKERAAGLVDARGNPIGSESQEPT